MPDPRALYLVAAGGNISAAATWDLHSGGTGGDGPPGVTTKIVCDAGSGAAVLTIDTPTTIGELHTNGDYLTGKFAGTINFAQQLTIAGDASFEKFTPTGSANIVQTAGAPIFPGKQEAPYTAVDWSAYTGTINLNHSSGTIDWEITDDLEALILPNLAVNNLGVDAFVLSAQRELRCGTLTLTAGVLNMSSKDLYLTGNLTTISTLGFTWTVSGSTVYFVGSNEHAVSMSAGIEAPSVIDMGAGSRLTLAKAFVADALTATSTCILRSPAGAINAVGKGATLTNCYISCGTTAKGVNQGSGAITNTIIAGTFSTGALVSTGGTHTYNAYVSNAEATGQLEAQVDANLVAIRGGNCDGTGDPSAIAGVGGTDLYGRCRKLRVDAIDIGPRQRQVKNNRNIIHPLIREVA